MKLSKRYILELIRKGWMQAALAIIMLLPIAIGVSLFLKALPLLKPGDITDILFGTEWMPTRGKFGLWPFISSSIFVTLSGLFLMIPVCLSAAIYITQYAPQWIAKSLRTVIDILAGIPSVIFGLWGVITIVPAVSTWALERGADNVTGYSIIAASVVLTVSVMPFVLNMLIELFESVPMQLKESVLAMGASHWQTIKDVIVKKLRPGIVASFTLGISKAFGETIAVLMVVGNVVQVPKSIFDAGYPLPALLANNYGEMMSIPLYDSALMLSAFILFVIVVIFNYISQKIILSFSKNQVNN
jgi:phosphate transport system permease protein